LAYKERERIIFIYRMFKKIVVCRYFGFLITNKNNNSKNGHFLLFPYPLSSFLIPFFPSSSISLSSIVSPFRLYSIFLPVPFSPSLSLHPHVLHSLSPSSHRVIINDCSIAVGVKNPHKFWVCRHPRNVGQTSRQISTTARGATYRRY
jgi:hypothetical protein